MSKSNLIGLFKYLWRKDFEGYRVIVLGYNWGDFEGCGGFLSEKIDFIGL